MSHFTVPRSPLTNSAHQPGLHRVAALGIAAGIATAAAPLALWWLPAATIYAMTLALIAAIYIGFAVADGRAHVMRVEAVVAAGFVLLAALAVTATPWVLVAGFALHGAKDLWQHRSGFVRQTRWWPPFCAVTDWVTALALTLAIAAGVSFR